MIDFKMNQLSHQTEVIFYSKFDQEVSKLGSTMQNPGHKRRPFNNAMNSSVSSNMNSKSQFNSNESGYSNDTKQVKEIMSEGKQLYEKATTIEEFEAALRLFSIAIDKSSSAQVLHLNHIYHLKGMCEFRLMKFKEAEKSFQEAIAISDDKSKVEFYNSLGKCKVKQAHKERQRESEENIEERVASSSNNFSINVNILLEEAIKCFEKSLECSNDKDGEAYLNLGLIYRMLKKNFKAIEYYGEATKYLQKYPESLYSTFIERGVCYRDIGEVQNSINDFLKSLEIKKDDPWGNFHLGISYMLEMNYQAALDRLSVAIQGNKRQPQFYNYKGLVLYMSGDYEACLGVFEEALKFYNEKGRNSLAEVGECWYNVGNALLNLNRETEALEAFQKASSEDYGSDFDLQIKLLYAEGRTYQKMQSPICIQKFKECLNKQQQQCQLVSVGKGHRNSHNTYENLSAKNISNSLSSSDNLSPSATNDLYLATLYHLGRCQTKYNLLSDAIDSFTRIIQDDCNDKCVYEERGKAYLKNENYEKAFRDFEVVVNIDESYPDIYYYRGMSKIYLDEAKVSEKESAVSKDDDDMAATSSRSSNGMIEEALKDFFKAIELGSKHIGIYNGISCAYHQAKKYQKALIYSNMCLANHPHNEDFLIQRSLIYLSLEEEKKSIDDLTTAMSVNRENPIIYYRRGLAYYKSKEYLQAISDLKRSLESNPNRNIQGDIHYHIGISYSNLENYKESIEPLTKAIDLDPQPRYLHERAKSEILIEENLNALNDLNDVIKSQPKNAFAYFRRGLAHKALKLYEEAADDFMKARELKPEDPRLIINKKQIYQTKYRKLCEAGEEE